MQDFIEGLGLMLLALFAFVAGLAGMVLMMAIPLIALGGGLALAYRLFCWIVGWAT